MKLKLCKIYNMDCIEGMKLIEDNFIDLVLTDPPYAIDFKAKRSSYNRTPSNVLDSYAEITPEKYYEFTKKWMSEVYRILKDSGSMFVFSGWNYLRDILNALDELGFVTVNHIVWKYQFGVATRKRFVTSHYHYLYTCKDDKKRKFFPYKRFGKNERDEKGGSKNYRDREDVWVINREYWQGDQKTSTKLPLELREDLVIFQ